MSFTKFRSNAGQILIVTAIALLGITGVTALSINAAYLYDKRNKLYAAADAAAKSVAIEIRRQRTPTNEITQAAMNAFADEQVAAHGLVPVRRGGTVTVTVRKCDDASATCATAFRTNNFVEAVVSETTHTFFGALLGSRIATPAARAVAGSMGSPHCLVVLDHAYFSPHGSAAGNFVNIADCSMVINGQASSTSSPELQTNVVITASTGRDIGVYHNPGCSGQCGNVTQGVPRVADPLRTLNAYQDPDPSGLCLNPFGAAGTKVIIDQPRTLSPGKYCGWSFTGSNAVLTLNPGKYYLTGNIEDSTGGTEVTINGTGVMVYLTAAARVNLDDSNHVTLNITAPTGAAEPYKGILFYQDRTTPTNYAYFGKNLTTMNIDGALYFPTQTISMNNENGNLTANPCAVMVAWAIEIDKPNLRLNNTCVDFSGSPVITLGISE